MKAAFKPVGAPWPLRTSEAFEFHSDAVGDMMAIGICSPSDASFAQSDDGPPPLDVIYVLDGSWALGMAAAICQLQYADSIHPGFAPVLLVGVDYPDGAINARSRDYTMASSFPRRLEDALSAIPRMRPGGADRFLAFLENELDPFIRSKYRTSDKPAGILGDSFGGTFTFYAFLKQSKLFDRYWLGSPAIFATAPDYVAQFEAVLKGPLVHPTKMFLSIGSLEIDGGIDLYEDLGRSYARLLTALDISNHQLDWAAKTYDGHTHTSVVAPALNDALIYLYGARRPDPSSALQRRRTSSATLEGRGLLVGRESIRDRQQANGPQPKAHTFG